MTKFLDSVARVLPSTVLRRRSEDEDLEVGYMELFFDLVYVFAIVQVSHFLIEHTGALGLLQGALIFLALWWAWNLTAWAMNWLDPEDSWVRLLLAVLMLCALGMAIAIHGAFDDMGLMFAGGYVSLQLLRNAFLVGALHPPTAAEPANGAEEDQALEYEGEYEGEDWDGAASEETDAPQEVLDREVMRQNYLQLGLWGLLSGVFWIGGGFAGGSVRVVLWLIALGIDYCGPLVGFYLPTWGPRALEDWSLRGEHLAERNRLVFIIALGESVLLLGASLAGREDFSGSVVLAALLGFVAIVVLWWVYFDRLPKPDEASPVDQARMARGGFAYAHALMVGGAIVIAVSIEKTVVHPGGHVGPSLTVVAIAGPVLFLLGHIMFRHSLTCVVSWWSIAAIVILLVLGTFAHLVTPLALSALVVSVFVVLVPTSRLEGRVGPKT